MLGPFQCGKNGFSWRECFTAYIPNVTPIITASNRLAHPFHTSRNQTSGLWFFLEVIHHNPDVEVPKCWSWPTCHSQGTPWLISKSVWFEGIEPHPHSNFRLGELLFGVLAAKQLGNFTHAASYWLVGLLTLTMLPALEGKLGILWFFHFSKDGGARFTVKRWGSLACGYNCRMFTGPPPFFF